MTPDLILVNGNVRTLDPSLPRASSLVLRAGEIAFVGDTDEALEMRSRKSIVLDARGQLVLPGFTDAHIHFTGFAQGLRRVNLTGCHSIEEAVERVAIRVDLAHEGETIIGWGWNHLDWTNPVFPDKSPLDQIAPSNPVILTRKDGHSAWVNTAALVDSGIDRTTADPDGGKLERGPDGEPNGLVRENALELLGKGIGKSDEEIPLDDLLDAIALAHRAGLTGIHNIEGANALRAWQLLHEQDKLKLRVIHSIPEDNLESAGRLGLRKGLGDEWLRVQAVKLFADGSLGSKTAEMLEPYRNGDERGMACTDSGALLELSRTAAQLGLDVWIHAIGDAAIRRTLDVFQTLRREGFRDSIFRVEHVQHLDPADLHRFSQLAVIASMQPIHQPSDMNMAEDLLGPKRAKWSYAWKSLENAGVTLAFGSDCPVERFEPLYGIHAAVTRQNEDARPVGGWFPEERLTVEQAVNGFTRGAAAASGDLRRRGCLAVGSRADAVILNQNIFEIPPNEILGTLIECTIVGGEIVHTQ